MKLKSKLKSKMKKGGNIDTEGLFITEKIKETVKKGLDKDLEKKYQEAYEKSQAELEEKRKLYETKNKNIQTEKIIEGRKDVPRQELIRKKTNDMITSINYVINSIWSRIKEFLSYIFDVFKKLFLSTGPMAHLVVFIIVLVIIYYIFYGISMAVGAIKSPSSGNTNYNSNLLGNSLSAFNNFYKSIDNYKYYNTGNSNFLNYFIPAFFLNNCTEIYNNCISKPLYGKDIYALNAPPRQDIITGRCNGIINIDIIMDKKYNPNDNKYVIYKPKDVELTLPEKSSVSLDINDLPPEILDDNIKTDCNLTLKDKKTLYIPYKVDDKGIYILDDDNSYYINKDGSKIKIENNKENILSDHNIIQDKTNKKTTIEYKLQNYELSVFNKIS